MHARLPASIAPRQDEAAALPASPIFSDLDRRFHAAEGRLTLGASPLALALAATDWAMHMANAPFRLSALALLGGCQSARLLEATLGGSEIAATRGDHRFDSPEWRYPPFSFYRRAFLLAEQWVETATRGVPGVNPENARLAHFAARQLMDTLSPSNAPWMNPQVLAATVRSGGVNIEDGVQHWLRDLEKLVAPPKPQLKLGRDLATTPGKVVYRNALIELIQYDPQTESVRPEPILIVPAWIMKYYILDLSRHNSLIGYLVAQGHTVFCISWRNPGAEMRETAFDDYLDDGVHAALDAASAICGGEKVHACGYCLGGTLLAIAAAAMARDGDDRLQDVTLFCAQTDFSEAGELQLYTTEEQVSFLEDVMAVQGYLDGRQMGSAFQLLRSRDLIWSRLLKSYWLGEPEQPIDLMVWNEDSTRLPARMHSQYLRKLFLHNDLAEGRFEVDKRAVSIGDIRAPMFVVATETDHIAPWRSVHKITLLNEDSEITFVLTTGGHNAGIVSEPGHPHRSFRIATRRPGSDYLGPEAWGEAAARREGSWWPAWAGWLAERSGPMDRPARAPGAPALGYPPIEDAPGRYVFER